MKQGKCIWGKRVGKGMAELCCVLCLEGIYLEVSEDNPNRLSSAFQVCPFRVMVSTDWSALGQGSLVSVAWS